MQAFNNFLVELSPEALCLLQFQRSTNSANSTLPQAGPLHIRILPQHAVGIGGSADIRKAEVFTGDSPPIFAALKIFHLPHTDKETVKKDHPTAPRIMFPWYDNGSIAQYLSDHPSIDPLALLLEVASGIEFMHRHDMVHGDLKCANIMIDDAGHARIIDFGLSRILSDVHGEGEEYYPSGTSLCWCAPELLVEGALRTKSSDIFAFGSTILELLTRSRPYASAHYNPLGLHVAIRDGARPREFAGALRSDVCEPKKVWSLLERCWDVADERPTIEEVICTLQGWESIL
ncbi:kinase-like domain-containing protein [Hysterangium stoloniferum]|nr:kinase-like domain-containing protein [Hysterangium stoloniferum]